MGADESRAASQGRTLPAPTPSSQPDKYDGLHCCASPNASQEHALKSKTMFNLCQAAADKGLFGREWAASDLLNGAEAHLKG